MENEKHTRPPKFATLLEDYQNALDAEKDKAKDLATVDGEHRTAEELLTIARSNLVTAMKTYGIQSIRERSWDAEYLYLNADGNLENRQTVTVEEADKKVEESVA